MIRAIIPITVCLILIIPCAGCVKHIKTYEPKRRDYVLPSDGNTITPPSTGSLWSPNQSTNYIFSDQRALLVNDVVTVRINEESSALSDASTKLDHDSEVKMGIDAMMGFLAALQQANPNLDRSAMIGASTKNSYMGQGTTSRRGRVKAVVPALVRKLLPNGNLFVEGHRVILVNDEEYHFYISGVVRPIDIDQTNSVDSSKIADAEIEFTGKGVIADKQSPGWFSRALDYVWPF